MTEVYLANCRPYNWEACQKETIFGLKLGRTMPPITRGDVILIRISGNDPHYGVKAIWYFDNAQQVDSKVKVPWTDGPYGWILHCRSIVTLPHLFNEAFKTSSKLSTKIPYFPASRIQPSIVHLKDFETKGYLQNILAEFGPQLRTNFSYFGQSRSIEPFLEEIISSDEHAEEVKPPPLPATDEEEEVDADDLEEEIADEEEEEESVPATIKKYTAFGIVGERIDLPILNYAPLNENGVILLFGYYLQDLGFSHMEEIRPGFPDAIGMQAIGGGKYKRVRIEFEFHSRSFQVHRHSVEHCDVIVCWIHDWPECPIEVIELRKVLFEH